MLTFMTVVAVLALDGGVAHVTAEQIGRDYTENEIRATGLYKGKRVTVTGEVSSVKLDPGGAVLLRLTAGGSFLAFLAALPRTASEKLANARRGDKLTVTCTVNGVFDRLEILGEECAL